MLKRKGKLIIEIGHKQKNQTVKILNENYFFINKISIFNGCDSPLGWMSTAYGNKVSINQINKVSQLDLVPTILDLLEIETPSYMTGQSIALD